MRRSENGKLPCGPARWLPIQSIPVLYAYGTVELNVSIKLRNTGL